MSSGTPACGMGCACAKRASSAAVVFSASASARPNALPKMPVAIAPGEIEFTRTSCRASSMATHRVAWMTAALATL